MATNNTISNKKINLKEEEKEEDEEVITQQLIDQSQQTSRKSNATDVIGTTIISQNVKLV